MTITIVDKDGKSISQGDVKSKPSDRHFRGGLDFEWNSYLRRSCNCENNV